MTSKVSKQKMKQNKKITSSKKNSNLISYVIFFLLVAFTTNTASATTTTIDEFTCNVQESLMQWQCNDGEREFSAFFTKNNKLDLFTGGENTLDYDYFYDGTPKSASINEEVVESIGLISESGMNFWEYNSRIEGYEQSLYFRIPTCHDVGVLASLAPVHVGTYHSDSAASYSSIVISGSYAYLANMGASSIDIIDISDPKNPQFIASYKDNSEMELSNPLSIAKFENYLFVKSHNIKTHISYGIKILDISSPLNPRSVGFSKDARWINDPAGEDTFMIGSWTAIIKNNSREASISISPRAYFIKPYLYTTDTSYPLAIYDYSDPRFGELIGKVSKENSRLREPGSIFVLGNYAYVGSLRDGMSIFDISDPANPIEVSNLYNNQNFRTINSILVAQSMERKYAYVNTNDAVATIDVTDPSTPFFTGSIFDNEDFALSNPSSMDINEVNGQIYAYSVSYTGDGLEILDVGESSKSPTPSFDYIGCDEQIIDIDFEDIAEFGTELIGTNWKTITHNRGFENPVVIAKSTTSFDVNPVNVRIGDVTPDSFKIKLENWVYQNQNHGEEIVSYIVMESGSYLIGGKRMEIGHTQVSSKWSSIPLTARFSSIPVVMSQSQTVNDDDPAITSSKALLPASFNLRLREEEQKEKILKEKHGYEIVGYIAAEIGVYSNLLEAGRTANSVTDEWKNIPFTASFAFPGFIADMQSANGDAATIRYRGLEESSVQLRIQDEQSTGPFIGHAQETVGYFVFASNEIILEDHDSDGILDSIDNCQSYPNPNQENNDYDTKGDSCDSDDDNDGLSDAEEIALQTNPMNPDTDGDGTGDKEDSYPLDISKASNNDEDISNNSPGLKLYYPFDNSVEDSVGTFEGKVFGSPVCGINNGAVGGACYFNGYSFISFDRGIGLKKPKAISVAAWIKPDYGAVKYIIANDHGKTFGISTSYANGYKMIAIAINGTYESILAPYNNDWVHFASVYNATTGELTVYINGARKESFTIISDLDLTGLDLVIGKTCAFAGMCQAGDNYYQGLIDELYVYNKVISAEEVSDLFNLGTPENDGSLPDEKKNDNQFKLYIVNEHGTTDKIKIPIEASDDHSYVEPRIPGVQEVYFVSNEPIDQAVLNEDNLKLEIEIGRSVEDISSQVESKGFLDDKTYKIRFKSPLLQNNKYLFQIIRETPDGWYDGVASFLFWVIAGDVNGDRVLDSKDKEEIENNFGTVIDSITARYDINSDGIVDAMDVSAVESTD